MVDPLALVMIHLEQMALAINFSCEGLLEDSGLISDKFLISLHVEGPLVKV